MLLVEMVTDRISVGKAARNQADVLAFTRQDEWCGKLLVFNRSGGYLLLVVTLCLMSIWAVFAVTLTSSYRHDHEQALIYAENVAALLASDIGRSFDTYDLSLKALIASLSDASVMDLPPAQRHRVLFDRSTEGIIFGSMLVVNADGILVLESRSVGPTRIDVSDRDYFRVFKDGRVSNEAYVSQRYKSRLSGEWMVGLSRRISHPDATFAGVAAGALKLDYFTALFATVRLPVGSRIELHYEDGSLLVDQDGLARPTAGAVPDRSPQRARSGRTVRDRDEMLVVDRKIPGLPLFQRVGLPVSVVMQDFWQRSLTTGLTFMVLSFSLVFMAAVLGLELRRRGLAEASLAELAATDALTGLSNRRRFDEVFQAEFRRRTRGASPLSLIVIDVDHFKRFNDTYGHTSGDAALRMVASVCREAGVRSSDVAARIGGEEFAVLLPDTAAAGAARLAERIAEGIRTRRIPHSASPTGIVTVSIGVTSCGKDRMATSPTDLFDEADAALYLAKEGGRDRVEVYGSGDGGQDRARA